MAAAGSDQDRSSPPLPSCLTRLGAPGGRRVAAPSPMSGARGCGQVPDLMTTAHRRGGPPTCAVPGAAWDAMPHRVSQGQAQVFLAGKYGAVEELRPLGGGFWSSAYSFSSRRPRAGRPLRANKDWFEADRPPWPSPRRSCPCPRSSKSAKPSTGPTPSQSTASGSTSKMSGLISQTPRVRCWRHCSQRCSGCRKGRTCRLAGTGGPRVAT
jgi:hypothetical protein